MLEERRQPAAVERHRLAGHGAGRARPRAGRLLIGIVIARARRRGWHDEQQADGPGKHAGAKQHQFTKDYEPLTTPAKNSARCGHLSSCGDLGLAAPAYLSDLYTVTRLRPPFFDL